HQRIFVETCHGMSLLYILKKLQDTKINYKLPRNYAKDSILEICDFYNTRERSDRSNLYVRQEIASLKLAMIQKGSKLLSGGYTEHFGLTQYKLVDALATTKETLGQDTGIIKLCRIYYIQKDSSSTYCHKSGINS
ncbi:MAG: hypothetical protein ACE5H1_12140, partial [Thermodesulfobacteriota bacterium]